LWNSKALVLTGCDVFICDFHREQSWERWTSTIKHGVSADRERVLTYLRRIADAPTTTAYSEAVNAFKDSSVWKSHRRLQQWFTKTWQREHKVYFFSVVNGESIAKVAMLALKKRVLNMLSV